MLASLAVHAQEQRPAVENESAQSQEVLGTYMYNKAVGIGRFGLAFWAQSVVRLVLRTWSFMLGAYVAKAFVQMSQQVGDLQSV